MPQYVVASVDEIPPGDRKIVEIAGRSIGIFNVDGEFFALRNRCPHEGGPLCAGLLCGAVSSEQPGEYAYSRPGQILRCPWHGWEFDIRTGQSWVDPRHIRVRRYEVTVAPEAEPEPRPEPESMSEPVVESLPEPEPLPAPPPAAPAPVGEPPGPGWEPGPFVAETYEVAVERRRIIVDVPA